MNRQLTVFLLLPAIVSCAFACSCGIEKLRTRIINGREAERNRYPWMVGIIGGYGACGGTIINDRYVLTAAHCMNGPDNTPTARDNVKVILGAYERNEILARNGKYKKLDIEWYEVHPDAGSVEWTKMKHENDIALIKLKEPLQLGDEISPICLPNFKTYSDLFTIGWGRHFNGKLVETDTLREAEVDEVDTGICRQLGLVIRDATKQICAGSNAGICNGDSGGPMSARINGHVYEVGVASFFINACGTQGGKRPDVYVRVTGHLDWIRKETQDAKWCDGPNTPSFAASKKNTTEVTKFVANSSAPVNKTDTPSSTVPPQPLFRIDVYKNNLTQSGPSKLKFTLEIEN